MSRGKKDNPARAKQASEPAEPQARAPGFEAKDVPPRPVIYLGLGLFAGIIASGALVAGLLTLIAHEHPAPHATALETEQVTPPEPRLEIDPSADRAKLDAEAESRLHGLEWADKAAGRARIPIDEAMRLTAQQGWADPAGKPQP